MWRLLSYCLYMLKRDRRRSDHVNRVLSNFRTKEAAQAGRVSSSFLWGVSCHVPSFGRCSMLRRSGTIYHDGQNSCTYAPCVALPLHALPVSPTTVWSASASACACLGYLRESDCTPARIFDRWPAGMSNLAVEQCKKLSSLFPVDDACSWKVAGWLLVAFWIPRISCPQI